MKKLCLFFAVSVTLLTYQAYGQTVSVLGTSGSTTAGGTFDSTISLQISGDNTIANVDSLNLILRTPSTGANSGAGLFTVQFLSPITPFTLANNPAASTFNTAGDSNNTGFTVSNPTIDLGATSPPFSAVFVNASAMIPTNFGVEVLRFTADPSTPAGTYLFGVSLGGLNDSSQGSHIANNSGGDFDVNDSPTFSITILPTAVPEPTTWWLIGLGGLGMFGVNVLRAHHRTRLG